MGVKKIDWIKIKNDYINGKGSYRELADKYGVSATSIGRKAREENWSEQREKQLHKSYTKVVQKTADKIAEREADRIARLLSTTDKLQDALDRAADELDKQIVKTKTKTTERKGAAGAGGKPDKEIVKEKEQIEYIDGCIDRKGLQQLSAAVKNLRDVITSLDIDDDADSKVVRLLGEIGDYAKNTDGR